jgi:hypothetical protein
MEVIANRGSQSHPRQYFNSGVLSVHCWEADDDALGVGVLIRKDTDAAVPGPISGSTSCGDVCEVRKLSGQRHTFQ